MANQSIPPQECFFYKGMWNEASVNYFIDILLDDAKDGLWEVNGDNECSLITALELLKEKISKHFTWDDVVAQHNMLEKRYYSFKAMLDVEGVEWDKKLNHVYAISPLWIQLIKDDDFAKAYYHKGDTMHDKLATLFGSEHNTHNEIIQISSEDNVRVKPNSVLDPITIADSDNEQEVNSPDTLGRKPPRKRLFGDDVATNTRALISKESTTTNRAHKCPNRIPNRPLFNKMGVLAPSGSTDVAGLIPKKESSSTASSSPAKWIYSPLSNNK